MALVLASTLLAACTGETQRPSPPTQSAAPTSTPSPTVSEAPEPDPRPNVLVIFTDDQRQLPLEVLRAVMPVTMHWMVDQGTYFPNAFATNPVCCPSRANLLSGQYSHNNGVLTNAGGFSVFNHEESLQHYLQTAGYRTGIVGKFFNHWDITQPPPYFDEWTLAQSTSGETAYYGRTFSVNGTIVTLPRYTTDVEARQAVQTLRNTETDDEQPWFLYVAPNAPHEPLVPKHEYEKAIVPDWFGNPSRNETDLSDKPWFVQSAQQDLIDLDATSRSQLRMLMSVDDLVDRIFEALREQGELNNTLVVFASDNGFFWGEHGLKGKNRPYTESSNVPLFLRWPGHVAKGAIDERLVGVVDIAPTIMDAVTRFSETTEVSDGWLPGVNTSLFDGYSLLSEHAREYILLESWSGNLRSSYLQWASLRTETLQYVEYYDAAGLIIFQEYYDLTTDPWEMENWLADQDATTAPDTEALSLLLHAALSCAGTTCP